MQKLTMTTISVGTGVLDGPETMGVDVLHGDAKKPFDCKKILFLKTFIPLVRTVEDAGPYGLGWSPFRYIKLTDKSKFETFAAGRRSVRFAHCKFASQMLPPFPGAAPYRV